ncbi:DUF4340 domain-containing protein [Pseudodesulfovibrio sp. JC047]|uniref:DUF4340 domain-containing protein n=1 Tax=Pseudodesulfovibrio sp. JC047 TaxID=2683199 RepID=UPI0013D589EA|nr:DUF4340 domain-containing protein [Pseudodesulfovibrio sp. JC047]NDV20603.1 DUF4340 domain-containing protein [Pseudodesulfovibrio sp. JC047]
MPDLKRRVFFAVIVLVIGVAGGAYWYTSMRSTTASVSQWLSRSLDQVDSIHVQTPGETYILKAVDDGWEIHVPGGSWNIKARALTGRVLAYESLLVDLDPRRSIGDLDSVGDQYGLDAPDLKVLLSFGEKGGEPLTIRLTSGASGVVYGWNSENPALVYEFDTQFFQELLQPAVNFFDTRVFAFEEQAIHRIQLVQPFGSSWLVELSKQGYTFSLPGYLKGKSASDSKIKLYIHALALLRAGTLILDPVVAEKQMAALTIRLWNSQSETPHSVEFYTIKDDPKHYLGRSSWLTVPFLLDVNSVSQLVRSAFDVQGRSVFSLEIGDVATMVIDHGKKRYVVERNDTGWHVRGREKNIPGIDMSLWRFTELQFEALPLNNLSASAVKLMQCQLFDEGGQVLNAMTFYADPKLPQGQCWIQNGDGMYYPVSGRLLKDLQGMFPAGHVK